MACNPQQIKKYAGGGVVRRGGQDQPVPDGMRRDPTPGTKGPNASRPRGSTGGGLNDLPVASPTPSTSPASSRLNPRTLDMEPRRNLTPDAYKKGGLVKNKAKPSPNPFAAKAAKAGGNQFVKPAKGNPFATKKADSGPVTKPGKGPVRKKFI